MYHNLLKTINIHVVLIAIDGDMANKTHQNPCTYCGGPLHQANYPRSPLGLPAICRDYYQQRYSFCCGDCRKSIHFCIGTAEGSIFVSYDLPAKMVSGEPVEARLPYGRPFTLTHYAKLIFNCNELPKDVEHSEAYFRRFIIIPFEVTIRVLSASLCDMLHITN